MAFDFTSEIERLMKYVSNSSLFIAQISSYNSTREPSARSILNNSLLEDERECLLSMYYGTQGWFKNRHYNGAKYLTMAAMNLKLTHTIYDPHDQKEQDKFLYLMEYMTEEQSILITAAYAKQKIATLKALSEIRKKNPFILLYRGIHDFDTNKMKYHLKSLESFTTSLKFAKHFAGNNGIIIKKAYPIENIFLYRTTIFKTKTDPNIQFRTAISVAKEYITENKDLVLDLEWNKNVFRSIDLS